jgi:hypothetical protein
MQPILADLVNIIIVIVIQNTNQIIRIKNMELMFVERVVNLKV